MGQEFLRQPLIGGAALAAVLAFGPGCVHVHTDGDGKVKSVEMRMSDPAAGVQPAAATKTAAKPDGGVKQAGATLPAVVSLPTLPKIPGLGGHGPGQATELAVTWQHRLAFLPDPARNGTPGPGIVGQMFMFSAGPKMPFATADGPLTVTMFDETPGRQSDKPLGSWTFDKDTLRRFITVDERFGKCYALFLPWPQYRAHVTRVKLTVRYDPETGYPLFTEPSVLTIDTSAPGGPPAPVASTGGFSQQPAAFGPAVPMQPLPTPPPVVNGPLAPALPPGGLPPIAFTVPAR